MNEGHKPEGLAVRKDWLERAGIDASSLYAWRVTGRSMEPRIQDGDTVLIDVLDRQVRDGLVFAIKRAGVLLIGRLLWRHDGALEFQAWKVIRPRPDISDSAAEVLEEPILVCKATGTGVTSLERQRGGQTEK